MINDEIISFKILINTLLIENHLLCEISVNKLSPPYPNLGNKSVKSVF